MNKTTPDKEKLREEFEKFIADDFDRKNFIHENETHRWIFCCDTYTLKNEENPYPYDCACCLTSDKDVHDKCNCACHSRIKEVADWWLDKMEVQKADTIAIIEGKKIKNADPDHYDDFKNAQEYGEAVGYNRALDDTLSILRKER